MNENILKILNLSKKYLGTNKDIKVLKNVNIKIKTGDLVALTGPSGSGKSTLLHLIALLDQPTTGDIYLAGKKISRLNHEEEDEIRKKKISIIYQQHNLLSDFTALENVTIPLIVNGKNLKESKRKAEKVLSQVNLSRRLNHFPSELSGGEQQRVAVARALITEPELILADEPTGSLDRKTAIEIFDLFYNLRAKKRVIIYATHNREFADMSDYKLNILDGNIKKV